MLTTAPNTHVTTVGLKYDIPSVPTASLLNKETSLPRSSQHSPPGRNRPPSWSGYIHTGSLSCRHRPLSLAGVQRTSCLRRFWLESPEQMVPTTLASIAVSRSLPQGRQDHGELGALTVVRSDTSWHLTARVLLLAFLNLSQITPQMSSGFSSS